MASKKVTINDIINAIEQNGLPQSRGLLFRYSDDQITAACAMGQAIVNLGVDSRLFSIIYDHFSSKSRFKYSSKEMRIAQMGNHIIVCNDRKKMSLKEIADELRVIYSDAMNESVKISTRTYNVAV
jgi:hypothetical protein